MKKLSTNCIYVNKVPKKKTKKKKNRFSSDHRSQVWLGEVSTWMGDRLGILRVVDFPF